MFLFYIYNVRNAEWKRKYYFFLLSFIKRNNWTNVLRFEFTHFSWYFRMGSNGLQMFSYYCRRPCRACRIRTRGVLFFIFIRLNPRPSLDSYQPLSSLYVTKDKKSIQSTLIKVYWDRWVNKLKRDQSHH